MTQISTRYARLISCRQILLYYTIISFLLIYCVFFEPSEEITEAFRNRFANQIYCIVIYSLNAFYSRAKTYELCSELRHRTIFRYKKNFALSNLYSIQFIFILNKNFLLESVYFVIQSATDALAEICRRGGHW